MAALEYIPAGTSIQFSVSGSADGTDDDDAQTAVRNALSKYFNVQRVYLDAPAFGGIYYGWPWTADIVVTTKEAHATAADVSSIVAHAVYEATGYMPSVSAPSYGGPSNADPGILPDLPRLPSGKDIGQGIADAVSAATKALGDGLKNLIKPTVDEASDTIMPIVIVVAVIAIVLVVNVSGKTTRVGVA